MYSCIEFIKKYLVFIVAFIIVITIVCIHIHNDYLLSKDYRYTLAKVSRVSFSGKVGLVYYVNNELQTIEIINCPFCIVDSTRFLVKFCTEKPHINEVYQEYEVPDSIINIPKNGWKNIPWTVESATLQ